MALIFLNFMPVLYSVRVCVRACVLCVCVIMCVCVCMCCRCSRELFCHHLKHWTCKFGKGMSAFVTMTTGIHYYSHVDQRILVVAIEQGCLAQQVRNY